MTAAYDFLRSRFKPITSCVTQNTGVLNVNERDRLVNTAYSRETDATADERHASKGP